MTTPPFLARYRQSFESTWTDDTPIEAVRFVVLDTETTGLNPQTDRIVTIGAVAVQNGEILLDDAYSALLELERNTEAVTVHGVTRDESRGGLGEADVPDLGRDPADQQQLDEEQRAAGEDESEAVALERPREVGSHGRNGSRRRPAPAPRRPSETIATPTPTAARSAKPVAT
ncbi:MAG: 3'-5' exonuclease, partial [Vicinamibacterales bacterium]